MSGKLHGKKVLVTGGSSAIGLVSAMLFQQPGALAAISGRQRQNLDDAGGALGNEALRSFGRPEKVAKAALFLASSDASYFVGEKIVVDGGMSLL